MVRRVNGKSTAPNDILAKFIIWLENACPIRDGKWNNHTIVHFLTAWMVVDHHCRHFCKIEMPSMSSTPTPTWLLNHLRARGPLAVTLFNFAITININARLIAISSYFATKLQNDFDLCEDPSYKIRHTHRKTLVSIRSGPGPRISV